ncbi:hypothetical protein AKO1_014690 [Acrasis kona]|uniref:Uncharacterized protein n=1 Tax=Acrasis kona TaxID=1008807 RepID=A0AAW2Z1P2_9EUKA
MGVRLLLVSIILIVSYVVVVNSSKNFDDDEFEYRDWNRDISRGNLFERNHKLLKKPMSVVGSILGFQLGGSFGKNIGKKSGKFSKQFGAGVDQYVYDTARYAGSEKGYEIGIANNYE